MLVAHFAASGSGVLDVPSWALAYVVFAVSVIVVLISRSRHVPRRPDPLPVVAADGPDGALVTVLRVVAGVVLVVLTLSAWFGPDGITSNLAPLFVVGVLWPLGGWIALAAGWCWETLDPFVALARIGDRRLRRLGREPTTLPWWAPVPVFATWVIVWVAWIRGDEPRNLAVWLTAYIVGIGIVAVRSGTAAVRAVNPLPAALDFTAAVLRPRRADARTPEPSSRGRVALIAGLTMGAIGANRAADAGWFTDLFPDEAALAATVATVVVFGVLTAVIVSVWGLCVRLVDTARSDAAGRRIAAALGPAAGGLLLAQGFPVGLIVAQNLAIVASDPFARGWDIFGTVYWQVSPDPLSGFALGSIQTLAIIVGQVTSLWMIGATATAPATDGSSSPRARNRAWTAALVPMVVVGVTGVAWTLLLVGR